MVFVGLPRLAFGISIGLMCTFVLMSCGQGDDQTPTALVLPESVNTQLASGAAIYTQTCASSTCHGTHGEGVRSANGFSAWPLVGPDFQARHPNAQVVFDVVRSGNEPNLRALTDQQIYDAIAYELSQNQITLQSSLTAANAITTHGGLMSGSAQGGLFPPADGVVMSRMPETRALPIAAESDSLRLQVDQLSEASAIGIAKPPSGSTFLIVVFVLTDLDQSATTVGPDSLTLTTPSGDVLQPQSINIPSAIERFHTQTITPEHGTATLAIFTLTAPDQFDRLVYDDGAGGQLALALKP